MTADGEGNALKLGDVISLFSEEGNGYLASEGSCDVRMLLYHNITDHLGANLHKPWKFNDCLFRVLPLHVNIAAKALRKLSKRLALKREQGETDAKSEDPANEGAEDNSTDLFKRLTAQVEEEKEANLAVIAELSGTAVKYGMVIHLQHVKTGLLVATQPKMIAEHERSCSAVLLQERITSGCSFQVESRYKFREAGAAVLKTDEVHLCNLKVEQFLHAGKRALPGQALLREVNASQILPTRWKVVLFSPYEKPQPPDEAPMLQAGSVVRLHHPESDTKVTIDHGGDGPRVLMQGFDGDESLEKTSSKDLWVIEKEYVTDGGPCALSKAGVPCSYRFRHMGSGRYLSARMDEPVEGHDGNQVTKWTFSADDATREKDSLFNFELNGTVGSVITVGDPVFLRHVVSNNYCHSGEAGPDVTDTYAGAIMSTPTLGALSNDEHTLEIHAAEPSEIADFWHLLGCMPMLAAFANRMNRMSAKNSELNLLNIDSTGKPGELTAVEQVKVQMALAKISGGGKPSAFDISASDTPLTAIEAKLVIETLTTLIFFVTTTESTDPFTCEGLPNMQRQKLMREQGLGEVLVNCLRTPFEGEPFAPYNLAVLEQGHFIIEIGQLTYRLLHHMSKGYRRNEFALAPHIDFFVSQSCATNDDNDLFAEATLTGLVSNNSMLLEEKIGLPQLRLFVDLLLEQDKDARYVKLLTATCACGSLPISSNQEALGALLLDDHATRDTLGIKGYLEKGVPFIEFVDYNNGAPAPLQQFLDDDDQEQIEYYISQLELFSEICFDRNYKGIFSVENMYSYETVLTCMQTKSFPYPLRAAFTKLILTVHLDREPQTVVQVPNLTRTNTEETPTVNLTRYQYRGRDFCDLKDFVIEYLEEMGGEACAWEHDKNQMTLYILDIVLFLSSAGFYSKVSDVQDLINPLVNNLDGTNDLTFKAEDQRTMADSDNQLRYVQREGTVAIMEAKIKMCQTLMQLSKLRLDNRITNLLQLYERSGADITPSEFDRMFQGSETDFQELSNKDVVAVLTDLIMYEHPGLADAAFSNLTAHFTQRAELLRVSERAQLLSDPSLIKLHDRVAEDLQQLHALVETEELWLGEDDPEDKAGQVTKILHSLLSYCQFGSTEKRDNPRRPSHDEQPRRKSQTQEMMQQRGIAPPIIFSDGMPDADQSKDLLRNLGAHRGVIEVLEIERLLVVDTGLDLLCLCHRFLQFFAQDVPANVEELSEYMDLFMDQLSSDDPAVVTASAETLVVIAGNALPIETVQACMNSKGNMVAQRSQISGHEFNDSSINLSCLDLLLAGTQVDGKPNKKTQMMVMTLLTNATRLADGPLQHQWLSDVGAAKLFDGCSSGSSSVLLTDPANLRLIDLMVECCRGKNGLAQARTQGVLALHDIATHMENLKTNREVKTSLFSLLHHAYLCCKHSMTEESAHNEVLRILYTDLEWENDKYLMTNQTGKGEMPDDMKEYLFAVLLPEIEAYFLDFASLAKGGEVQEEMSKSVLTRVVSLFGRCSEARYKRKCSQICHLMLGSNKKLFKAVQSKSGDWCEGTEGVQKVYAFLEESTDEEEEEFFGDAVEKSVRKPKTQFVKTMDRLRQNDDIMQLVESEFEEMCQCFKTIQSITKKSFSNCVITFNGLITALITLVDINDFSLGLDNSLAALKILRKMVEMENPASALPASEWESEDWEDVQDEINEWQGKMSALGCVDLVMNLVGEAALTPVVMAAIDVGVTLLLGGNEEVQNCFAEASDPTQQSGDASAFYHKLMLLLIQSYDEMKSSSSEGTTEQAKQRPRTPPRAETPPETPRSEEPLLPKDDEDGDETNKLSSSVHPSFEEEEEEEEEEDDFDENKNATVVFRFMQLLCEGHNLECQKLMQKQPGNVSYDLLAQTLSIVRLLTCDMPGDLDDDRFEAACQGLDTLIELIQGPCSSAQHSLMENKVLEVCCAIMADDFKDAFPDSNATSDDPHPLIMDAKEKSVTLLLSLLERVNDKTILHKFGDTLDFEVLKARMAHVYRVCLLKAELDPTSVADPTQIPEDIYSGDLNEAFAIYMLMATVGRYSTQAKEALLAANYSTEDVVALEFFQHNTGCIEVNWEGELERVYFPVPPICEFLTEASVEKVKWGLNRETPGEKVQSFFEYTPEMYTEMKHLQEMSQYRSLAFLSLHVDTMKMLQLVIAVITNALILLSFEVTTPTIEGQTFEWYTTNIDYNNDTMKLAIQVLMGVLSMIAFLIFISMSCTFGPLAIKNSWAQRQLQLGKVTLEEELPEMGTVAYLLRMGPEDAGVYSGECSTATMMIYHFFSSCYFLTDTVVLLHLVYFLFGVCGNAISPFFLCFHLLDLVYTSETLKNVLKAVTFNGQQLMMTAMLAWLVIWVYSIFAFVLLRNNYLNDDLPDARLCDTLLDCFLVTTREGLINGGGMGDYLQPRAVSDIGTYMGRFVFDLTFFLLIIIILLNIIFGIIIDTFSAMREETESAAGDMKNVCTMCGIERADLDRNGSGFDQHIKLEHNMWKYLYYLVYLEIKDETEFTGLETFVKGMADDSDLDFYPQDKALCMDDDGEEEEDEFHVEVNQKLREMENNTAMIRKTLADIKSESSINQAQSMSLENDRLLKVQQIVLQLDTDKHKA